MANYQRKQLFVDNKVQGALLLRTIAYWFYCLLTVGLMLLCWRVVTGPARMFYTHFDDMWFLYGPALVASLLLLPIVVMDSLRLTNKFAGPVLRLRRGLKQLAKGQPADPIYLREGDFWHDFAQDFNAVATRLENARAQREDFSTNGRAETREEPVGV